MSAPTRPSLSPRSTTLGASSSASTARNPLHLKVSRLLASKLEDAGTRAALDTLGDIEKAASELGAGKAVAKGIGAAGIGGALRRGGLRKEVEGRMAEGSREFLEAFSEVNDVGSRPSRICSAREKPADTRCFVPFLEQKLANLQAHLDAMHVCCDQVQGELEKANVGTRYLLEHAEGLRAQRFVSGLSRGRCGIPEAHLDHLSNRVSTSQQQTLAHLFLARFTLTDAELRALTSREVPVGRELFEAMDKTERIRGDCRALLSGEAGEGTQAG